MSEADENAAVIKIGEAGEIPVKEIEEISVPSTDSALDSSVEKEISEIVQHSDPISPATAVSTNDAPPLSDDETPKIILNLEVSSIEQQSPQEEDIFNNADLNKVAMEQLDQLTQKKKVRVIQKDPLSIAHVQAEKVSPKADQNGKSPVKLHNRILASSSSAKDYEKVVMAQTKISLDKPKKAINPAPTATGNEDLVAILEGHDTDDKDEVHYEVVEIIPDSERKPEPTVVTTVLTKEEERKIALEQMSSIPKMGAGRRGRKRKSSPEFETLEKAATDLVISLASEWSDGEKDAELKTETPSPPKESKSMIKKETEGKKSVEIKVEPFRRTRVVKKKIIWDPDAPETQFSYASLVQSSAKKSTLQRKSRATPTPTPKKSETPTPKAVTPLLRGKRRSETPTILNNKKKKSEIDKLLGDEGAANMLHSLENEKSEKDTTVKKEAPNQSVEKQTKRETPIKKRGPKPKSAASSWDYVYKQRNDDAMIIRRRSNSSYSSTSPRRLSLEQPPAGLAKKVSPVGIKASSASKGSGITKSVTVNLAKGKSFEFAKPEAKKVRKENDETIMMITSDIKRESLRRGNRTPINADPDHSRTQAPAKVDKEKNADVVVVRKHGNVTELHLQSKTEKVKHTFTSQLMNEVVKQLDTLKGDNTCKVVFITTSGPNFCHGIDFISLTVGTAEKRKNVAAELALSVRNFLEALASFPKPLLAGIQGTCSGLGVTMLPLFDVVISSDKSTFDTNYAKIGQIPEGHCILTLTNNVGHNFKIKLLWLSEKINSTEAALSGLVTKLTSPTKIQEDTLLCAKKVASLSQQTFSSMKAQRQKSELPKLTAALIEEQKILSQQWISSECQEKFKQYIQKECW